MRINAYPELLFLETAIMRRAEIVQHAIAAWPTLSARDIDRIWRDVFALDREVLEGFYDLDLVFAQRIPSEAN